jgi:very-short-patch-repair endonuclease
MKTISINGRQIKRRTLADLPQNIRLKEFARQNRKGYNLAEVMFWKQVHKKKFHGIDFNRQYVIGDFIADFYARSLGLVVEVDGGYHNGREEYDLNREVYMESLGILTFRTTDYDIIQHPDVVMRDLEEFIVEHYAE